MRIAILTSSYPRYPGDGTAPFVKSIAEALGKRGHSVEVVAPYDPDVKPIENGKVNIHRFRYWLIKSQHIMGHGRALEADVRLQPLAFLLLPFYLFAAFIALWRVTGRQKSDVIHVHWVLPNGPVAATVARLRHIPFIVSLHGSDIYMAKKNPAYGAAARWVFRRVVAATACSPELRDAAIQLGAPVTTELLAWGADPSVFKPVEQRDVLRLRSGWGEGPVILALGRMVYKKGFDVLLRALPSVFADRPDIKVSIGGDGPLSAELQALATDLGIKGSVDFIGRVPWDQVPQLFSAGDIFVLPSVRDRSGNLDGLPTVLLEAMGCGCAVVASDIGGVSLAIRDHENGLLVKPGSVSELTDALRQLISDPAYAAELGKAARKTVVEDLNWDKVAERIEELLYTTPAKISREHRMGTIYREAMLASLDNLGPTKGRVLDVGCHDGLLLSKLEAGFRVGVDLHPIGKVTGISLVQADARFLPFKKGSFDKVYALDVIEHIEDDVTFANSIIGTITHNGSMLLTTPSASIRLYPPFLTTWISRQWGHIYRLGYTPSRLVELFASELDVNIRPWNAPAYRFFYPFLRIMRVLFPKLVERWVIRINRWDAQRQEGQSGFLVMNGVRKDQAVNKTAE